MAQQEFFAPRICLREPIEEIFLTAEMLANGVDAHLNGDIQLAKRMFQNANMQEVWDWTDSIWGKNAEEHIRYRSMPYVPRVVPLEHRYVLRMPRADTLRAIIERDGYNCRFCGIPVVSSKVRDRIHKAYPAEVVWERSNQQQHAALQCMWLQFDHILPHNRGGTSELDNMLVTCAACNYGKSNYTIEELGLIDPRSGSFEKSNWDGLKRFK